MHKKKTFNEFFKKMGSIPCWDQFHAYSIHLPGGPKKLVWLWFMIESVALTNLLIDFFCYILFLSLYTDNCFLES